MHISEHNGVPVLILKRPMPYARYERYAKLLRQHRQERLVFCHHLPVITLGMQTRLESVLMPESLLIQKGIDLVTVPRGGDATAHEPGQIVVYPHLDLRRRKLRIGDLVKTLLDVTAGVVYDTCGIQLFMNPEAPGLYAQDGTKVVSAGLAIRQGFSSSGIAINWNNSLSTFAWIHPCGHVGLRMQSIEAILRQSQKKNDLLDEEKKKEFCRVWAERFFQSPCLRSS